MKVQMVGEGVPSCKFSVVSYMFNTTDLDALYVVHVYVNVCVYIYIYGTHIYIYRCCSIA